VERSLTCPLASSQINDPVDGEIAAHIDAVAQEGRTPPACTLVEARAKDMLSDLGEEDFETYIGEVLRVTPAPSAPAAAFKVAYTPLHGVGAHIAERLLKRRGYQGFTVAEQREPDGHFPTVKFPSESHAYDQHCAC
jgi:phosphomannomutase